MNLYPPDDTVSGPLAPADWTMSVIPSPVGEGGSYLAEVKRTGATVCRLTVAGAFSEDNARRLLAEKARLWIAEYLARPHSGETDFGSLDE
jgi:hypothetical protein